MNPYFRRTVCGPRTHSRPFSPAVEVGVTWVAIAVTLVASSMAMIQLIRVFLDDLDARRWAVAASHPVFWAIIAFLIYGGLVYLLTRLAYLRRGRCHSPASDEELDRFRRGSLPALTILVPSYKEEETVVINTLLSVALQDYPKRRVVLLIDDPPLPHTPADRATLTAARTLPERVAGLLRGPAQRYACAMDGFLHRQGMPGFNRRREAAILAGLHRDAAAWFEKQAERHARAGHADALLVDSVLLWHRRVQLQRTHHLIVCLQDPNRDLTAEELLHDYQQLVRLFTVEVTSFERKRYENLSHEPNKAMNLNSYIGLAGRSFRERRDEGCLYLEEARPEEADFSVPDADYFVTLDADSLVTPDYALRLIHFMEQPGSRRIAVAQTPYNAIPNAPAPIERIAGATTDIQYIIHQGFTAFDATYWVGANALLRKAALFDIAVKDVDRGYPITKYIQDRTVIEDTESSIDLVSRGWQLYNYPERLSFSATPSDFGSLIIQRRRWANGGLIIFPKLLRLLDGRPPSFSLAAQWFMRMHYLVSIAAVNIGLVLWLLLPTGDSLRLLWLPCTALPYYLLYMRDLVLLGYRRHDVLSVYALNLLLIPVNLAGVFKSLQQLLTRRKVPFGRTPKVQMRTAAAPSFILAEYALVIGWFALASLGIATGHWLDAVFGMANASLLLYAILRYVGLRNSLVDLLPSLRRALTSRRAAPSSLSQMQSQST